MLLSGVDQLRGSQYATHWSQRARVADQVMTSASHAVGRAQLRATHWSLPGLLPSLAATSALHTDYLEVDRHPTAASNKHQNLTIIIVVFKHIGFL